MAKRLILAILLLLPVICSAQQGYNGKYFITNSLRLGASKDSFARGGSALDVTGLVKFFSYASPDTNTVLGVDGNGNVVLRTKGNGSGGSTDSAVFATLYALYDTAHNLRGYVNGLFTAYYTASQVNNLLGNYYDKTTSDGKYVKYADTTITIATETERKRDSLLAANGLAARVKYSDTAAMLLPYLNAINARVKYTDTASMLTAYRLGLLAKLNISDTAAMLAAYQAAILQRVKYGDTASMLANYQAAINARLKYTDTAGMLAAYQTAINNINANKIPYADTTTKVVTPAQLNDSLAKENLQAITTRGNNTTNGVTIGTATGSYFTDSIVVQGTSIEAGYVLPNAASQAWPIQMGNMAGYGVINIGVSFSTYTGNDSVYRRIPPKRTNIKYIVFGGPVNDANSYPTDTLTYVTKMLSVMDSLVTYKGYSYSDFYFQTPLFIYRSFRNTVNYPALLIYTQAVKNLANRRGVNVMDLFSHSYSKDGFGYTFEGVHPNYKGIQYLAQFTTGNIPRSQHNANDKFRVNGLVELGDSIRHMTTRMATANSGVRILGIDSTGTEVYIPGDEYLATANINDVPTGGGINTTEPITTARSLNAGTFQLYGTGTNVAWLGENIVYDAGITTSYTYKANGYGHLSQFFGGGYNYFSAPSGTAGAVVPLTLRAKFTVVGSIGLGATGTNNGDQSVDGFAFKIFPTTFNAMVGNSNTDNGYKFEVVGTTKIDNVLTLGFAQAYASGGYLYPVRNTTTGNIETKSTIPVADVTGAVPTTTTVNGHALSSNVTVTASDVGLGNVNNTSDANKPVSTATQTALNLKVDSVNVSNDSVYDWKNGTKTFRFMRTSGGGGSGTVTSASVVPANGFAGSVATSTTTPAITISTTVTGILKGNGTAISAATSGTDYLAPNSVITGATKTKITYDANGLVTAGADATTADIAASTNKNYVTDAQQTVIGNTSGTNTGDQANVTGNAGTATILQTPRSIYGSSFNGSADISGPIIGTYGGTGVNNGSKTIAISGNTSIGSSTNTVTLATSGNTSVTLPPSGTLSSYVEGNTASSSTPTPTGDARVNYYDVTALAAAATIGAPTGTPANHNAVIMRIKDNATARALSFNAIYRFSTDLPAPTTTVISKTLYLAFIYNSADSKWDCVTVINNY